MTIEEKRQKWAEYMRRYRAIPVSKEVHEIELAKHRERARRLAAERRALGLRTSDGKPRVRQTLGMSNTDHAAYMREWRRTADVRKLRITEHWCECGTRAVKHKWGVYVCARCDALERSGFCFGGPIESRKPQQRTNTTTK